MLSPITGIFLYADTRPNVIQVTRSITIQAPAEKIFPFIDDFHHWPAWAPQDKEDPTMKRIYSGEQSGTGAISDWQGTGNAGKGRMTIVESAAPNKVVVKVDFVPLRSLPITSTNSCWNRVRPAALPK